ncbi:MAG: nickel pincer cofactor biosynthesis protein LarB [Pirellulaceae bacterium]
MNRHDFEQAARMFRAGKLSLADFSSQVTSSLADNPPQPATRRGEIIDGDSSQEFQVDTEHRVRCGYPEVVYAPGKSIKTLRQIIKRLTADGEPVLITRIEDAEGRLLCEQFPGSVYNARGQTFRLDHVERELQGMVAVVTAGTGDQAVAEEAIETLKWMGVGSKLIADLGDGGPSRLQTHISKIQNNDAVIVVAGWDGALPSIVAGYVNVPVFAVPTSAGYGANFGGIASLLSMLNSSAANVAVVNIDGGFKAGYLAGMVSRQRRGVDHGNQSQ